MNARNHSSESDAPCTCGRSPTGLCLGWHDLETEEFKTELKNWISEGFLAKQLTDTVNAELIDL